MEILSIENLNFTYSNQSNKVLENINFTVYDGDFLVFCGASGCGKTTLLKLIKKTLNPYGNINGTINLNISNEKIGYVFQNPESQIVMENVIDELIFGCENVGMTTNQINLKLSEITSFFGIEKLLYKKCSTLSGGQKQLINLASIMMIEPELLLLDEPLSQLDPIASTDFINILTRIHNELGLTVIICEHNIDDFIDKADQIIYFKNNTIISFSTKDNFIDYIITNNDTFYESLPTTVKLVNELTKDDDRTFDSFPITVADTRKFVKKNINNFNLSKLHSYKKNENSYSDKLVINAKNVYFKYDKHENDVLNNFSLSVHKGEFLSIIGGNGAGKSTLLSLLTGYKKPYKGKIKINGNISYLPQNPTMAFIEDVLISDLKLICRENKIDINRIDLLMRRFPIFKEIKKYLNYNPLDLSGGQMQLAALFKILLLSPDILLLDEPTKGLDNYQKKLLSNLFDDMRKDGVTIIMVSHDLNFVAQNTTTCAMMFQGQIITNGNTETIIKQNHFYTTPLARVLKGLI